MSATPLCCITCEATSCCVRHVERLDVSRHILQQIQCASSSRMRMHLNVIRWCAAEIIAYSCTAVLTQSILVAGHRATGLPAL